MALPIILSLRIYAYFNMCAFLIKEGVIGIMFYNQDVQDRHFQLEIIT